MGTNASEIYHKRDEEDTKLLAEEEVLDLDKREQGHNSWRGRKRNSKWTEARRRQTFLEFKEFSLRLWYGSDKKRT